MLINQEQDIKLIYNNKWAHVKIKQYKSEKIELSRQCEFWSLILDRVENYYSSKVAYLYTIEYWLSIEQFKNYKKGNENGQRIWYTYVWLFYFLNHCAIKLRVR